MAVAERSRAAQRSTFDFWLALKVWGVTIRLTFLFAAANMPMLLRHGLDAEKKAEADAGTPVE